MNICNLNLLLIVTLFCTGRPRQSIQITSWGIIDQGTNALNPNAGGVLWKSHRQSISICSINTGLPSLANPCNTTVIKKIFKRPPPIQWQIVDKDTIDEIIFRTTDKRNRLMLELMARGGMRVGEVLKLTPDDVQECSLSIHNPKSGRKTETVYVPRKILGRLSLYIQATGISRNPRIFPISYVAAWSMVLKPSGGLKHCTGRWSKKCGGCSSSSRATGIVSRLRRWQNSLPSVC